MKSVYRFAQWTRQNAKARLVWLALPVVAAVSFYAISQSSDPVIPAIVLAPEPLYAKQSSDKPTLSLALSVEFPTVGAQHLSEYSQATEYLGYFDADSCYSYVDSPAAVTGYSAADLKRFDRTGPATARGCGGTGFSGNFMNWATSSAIDVLRLGLTGGDRTVDTPNITILQRAVLRNGGFYNDANFPAKTLPAAIASAAVPTALLGTFTGDVKIANCLNRVHFGTDSEGSCGDPQRNSNLGTVTNAVTSFNGSLTGFQGTQCAGEGGNCAFTGTYKVAYGAGTTWKIGIFTNGTPCTNDVFGDPIVGVFKRCFVSTAPETALPYLTSDRFFYTRVKVCDSTADGVLLDGRKYTAKKEDYCVKYPNGKYKPVGQMQRYSDRVRLAAFGYLMDDTLDRYGGVLRAPMKYVGPKTFDSNGVLSATINPNSEWDESTGVFAVDPLKTASAPTAEGKSGVINYLNQFGRTGTTQGRYKTYDPVGELYYEAVRYIQGLDPTTQATVNITANMKDGFPVYDKGSSGLTLPWVDPHASGSKDKDYACLKNNIVVIGDTNTHADKSVPGNSSTTSSDFARSADISKNEPDFRAWTNVVGAFEAKSALSYKDGTGTTRNTNAISSPVNSGANYPNLQNAVPPCCNNNTYLMAGVAYWANTHDVRGTDWTVKPDQQRPGMRITTYVLDVNEFGNANDLTARRNNQFHLAAKYGGFIDKSGGKGNPFMDKNGAADSTGWDPNGTNLANRYFLSSSANDVLQALQDIFDDVAKSGSSIAGGAISTQRLTSVGGFIYQAQFDASDWSGDLVAYPVSVDSNRTVTIADGGSTQPAAWRASEKLNGINATDRKIFAGKVTPDVLGTAVEFKALGDLETSLQTALSKATPVASADALAQSRINFIRGDRSLEGTTFRKRGTSVLGDIINSGVAFSGEPSKRISSPDYLTFFNANKNRTKALFVGANDGLLHAFNANSGTDEGKELFSYIPSWLVPKLPALGNATYNNGNHQSFMDGSPSVGEALVGSTWKTVLVSGTGGGGQGVFALDITNPTAFNAASVMWEFTDKDDADMGNVIGRPQILKFKTSAPGASSATYQWFAVVPSGVNNYVADGYASKTGRPALFLLSLNKSSTDAWTLGSNYYKISLRYDGDGLSTPTSTKPTGLANFSATAGPADEVSLIYAADLSGNVWKLDFSTAGFNTWKTVAADTTANPFKTGLDILSPFTDSGGKAIPFYIAKDGASVNQPITMAPALVNGPSGGVIVAFGTGKYLETNDNTVTGSTQIQTIYALLDTGTTAGKVVNGPSIISGKARLAAGSINSAGVISFSPFLWGRALTDADTTQRSGWYFNFNTAGERQISGFGIFGNKMVFGSVIPPDAAIDACGSGNGFLYSVNIATGAGKKEVSEVGLLGEPFVLEVGDAAVTKSDSTGRRIKTTTGQIILQGSTGLKAITTQPTDQSIVGRLSWRQIYNYQDLKNAP